jgi:hypothetical protein
MEKSTFLNLPCLEFSHGDLAVRLTTTVGPRVLALLVDGKNIFAELPDVTLDHPSGHKYSMYGGHRLWYAPEFGEVTYLPDDNPVMVEEMDEGIRLIQRPEPGTGMEKSIGIRRAENGGFRITHTLTNQGDASITCAPWAITQLKTGGTAFLPQAKRIPGWSPFQPNRSIALWPYTKINDPHLHLGDQLILVSTDGRGAAIAQADLETSPPALKIGIPNPTGWLAYYLNGLLFVKFAGFDPDADYFDLNATSQVYNAPRFIELETLGPKVVLSPGESTQHLETWRVYRNVDFDGSEDSAAALATALNDQVG